MKSMQRSPHYLLTILIAATIAACDSGGSSGAGISNDPEEADILQWMPCAEDSRLECASLDVPMAHNNPQGEKITVALNRLRSTSEARRGSLLFNPGGPGASGVNMLFEFIDAEFIPEAVTNTYDLVGFDPRGVNKSTAVDCSEFIDEDINDYPLDLSELLSFEAANANYVTQCIAKYGTYLQHLGSADVVDDMELIRIALGEPKLDFLGYSYGTRLAAIYAQQYPTTTGRMILDASLPPTSNNIKLFEGQLLPHENNLALFASLCVSHSDCNAVTYKQQIIDHINKLIDDENEFELDIAGTVLLTAIQEPQIASELTMPFYEYMQTNDLTTLIGISELIYESESIDYDDTTPERAVLCADDATRPTIAAVEALRSQFNEQSDLIAELQLASAASCINWPEALRPLAPIATDTAPELLVIAGPSDSQTPSIWGERMAQAIGARYLLSEHPGHTVVFNGENPCTDEVAIDYLVNGNLPAREVCPIPSE